MHRARSVILRTYSIAGRGTSIIEEIEPCVRGVVPEVLSAFGIVLDSKGLGANHALSRAKQPAEPGIR